MIERRQQERRATALDGWRAAGRRATRERREAAAILSARQAHWHARYTAAKGPRL